MNLKNPKEVACTLRDIEGECAHKQKLFEEGFLPGVRRDREVLVQLLRGLSVIAEFLDPDMPSESLEPFRPKGSSVAGETPLPPRAREEYRLVALVAEDRATKLDAEGDVEGAARVRDLARGIVEMAS